MQKQQLQMTEDGQNDYGQMTEQVEAGNKRGST